jgi:hypothetical protein
MLHSVRFLFVLVLLISGCLLSAQETKYRIVTSDYKYEDALKARYRKITVTPAGKRYRSAPLYLKFSKSDSTRRFLKDKVLGVVTFDDRTKSANPGDLTGGDSTRINSTGTITLPATLKLHKEYYLTENDSIVNSYLSTAYKHSINVTLFGIDRLRYSYTGKFGFFASVGIFKSQFSSFGGGLNVRLAYNTVLNTGVHIFKEKVLIGDNNSDKVIP